LFFRHQAFEIDCKRNLLIKAVENILEHQGYSVFGIVELIGNVLKVTGIHYKEQIIYDVDDLIAVRLIEYVGGIDVLAAVVISQYSLNKISDLISYVLLHIHVSLSTE
jgi:hypothetical protein